MPDAGRRLPLADPLEEAVAAILDAAGIAWVSGTPPGTGPGMDFYLPDLDLYIEVKQYFTPRIVRQMQLHPSVIVLQGWGAVNGLRRMLEMASAGANRPTP